MCGIAGKITWNGNPGTETVVKMCERMVHRGPDDSGIVNLKNAVLGHRRLSIIDLSDRARQPMVSADNRYYIVYNGEIYNFRELKKELEEFNFKTTSDTEVVLNSYIKWGFSCLNKFNGMFAFAIWDDKLKELFLARDRFGKKPLYYHIDSEKIVFASELTALMCDDSIPKNISYEALNCYLALGYILSPLTLYKDVNKLESSTFIYISSFGKKIEKKQYWDYAEKFFNKTKENEMQIAENVAVLVEESVKKRMISDVPLGAFLSGGIDSSSVVSFAKRHHVGSLHTFSMGFDQKTYSELNDADWAAKYIGTIHHNKICKVGENQKLLDDAINVYDEPFADNSLIPTVELSKFTSSFVKVALSGDAGDEMFAGYETYKADKYYFFAKPIPDFIKKLMIRIGNNASYARTKRLSWAYKQKQFFNGTLYSPEEAHYMWRLIFPPEERVKILGEKFKDLVYDTDPFKFFKKYYDKAKEMDLFDRHFYVDAMTWLTDDILVKVDRASMSSSLEVRCPYLDVDLVSYAASIPAALKIKNMNTKYILKKAFKKILPGRIINKKKRGFNAPTGSWIGYDGVDEFRIFNKYVFDKKFNHNIEKISRVV